MMETVLLAVGVLIFICVYCYFILPFPFFEVRAPGEVVPSMPTRSIIAALRHACPTLVLRDNVAKILRRVFKEPNRPLTSWRDHSGYYHHREQPTRILNPRSRDVFVFRSRLTYTLLGVRLLVDNILCPLLTVLLLTLYAGVILIGLFLALITRLSRRPDRDADDEQALKLEAFEDHIRAFFPVDRTDPLGIFAEPGYFMFKLAEGYRYRQAIRKFGTRHPNCEIGPDNGEISVLHLKGVDFIDEALNTSPWSMTAPEGFYRNLRVGFMEGDPFPDRVFEDIYIIHVVDHIPDLDAAFRPIVRRLSMGGRIFFSGLTHDFDGWYLRELCAAGGVHNNKNLAWYAEFGRRHGLRLVWGAYCQAPRASAIFKMTYGFVVKTNAWRIVAAWFGRTPARRRFAVRLVRMLWTDMFLHDGVLVERANRGLNFVVVMEKVEEIPASG